MAKCLNCGKEVKNKFCNVHCQNEYKGKQNKLLYEQSPNYCKHCGKPLPWEKRRNLYCNSSCAASENNKGITRNSSKSENTKLFKDKLYALSDDEFKKAINENHTVKDLYKALGYSETAKIKEKILKRCSELGITWNIKETVFVMNKTKGDLFKERKNWQSARSDIRRQADKMFEKSRIERKCLLCGYDKHIEIAHIKAVADFDDSSLVSEINDIHNLIPLCPNHHWEFDHNCLSEENLDKIKKYSELDL